MAGRSQGGQILRAWQDDIEGKLLEMKKVLRMLGQALVIVVMTWRWISSPSAGNGIAG
jgi:hypothetical protein